MGWKLRIVVAVLIVAGGYLAYTKLSPEDKEKARNLADKTVEGMRTAEKFMDDPKFKEMVQAHVDLAKHGFEYAKVQVLESDLEQRLEELETLNAENPAHRDTETLETRSAQIRALYEQHRQTIDAMWGEVRKLDPEEAKQKYQEARIATEKFQKLTTQGKQYLGEEQFQEIADSLGAFLKSSSGE